jgi:hypothetical protein
MDYWKGWYIPWISPTIMTRLSGAPRQGEWAIDDNPRWSHTNRDFFERKDPKVAVALKIGVVYMELAG